MGEIGLADAIRALRSELAASVEAAENEAIRFRLGTVDLEFQVAVSDKIDGNAGIKFWVLNTGITTSEGNSTTHTVRVQLHAGKADGSEVWTGDSASRFPD